MEDIEQPSQADPEQQTHASAEQTMGANAPSEAEAPETKEEGGVPEPTPVDGTGGVPEQTDNRPRDEDGEQDVTQEPEPPEGSV